MSRYASIDCPVCQKPLDNGEEVVVCPECGAPYHRGCIQNEGCCIFTDLHEKGESWHIPKPKQTEEKFDKDAPLRCSRCGTVNPPFGIFCQVCGNRLAEDETTGIQASPQAQQNTPPPFGSAGYPPPGIPLNPYTTPFGGVAPDEEIDGIPAKDLAIFVGRSSHYYLPHFKQLAQSGRKILNWGAFFFEGGYFLFRKMYAIGILLLLADLLLGVPNALLILRTFEAGSSVLTSAETAAMQNLSNLVMVFQFFILGLRFLCGLLANTLYKKHCWKAIKKEQAVQRPQDEYYAALSRRGSVAMKLVSGLVIGFVALYIVATYLIILVGI